MPDKRVMYTVTTNDGRTEEWDQKTYDELSPSLYENYPGAKVARVSAYDPADDDGNESDRFQVQTQDGRVEQWSRGEFNELYESLKSSYPDAEVYRISDMSDRYWRPKLDESKKALSDFDTANGEVMRQYEQALRDSNKVARNASVNPAQKYVMENREQYESLKRQRDSLGRAVYDNPIVQEGRRAAFDNATKLREEYLANAESAATGEERRDWKRAAKLQQDAAELFSAPSQYQENGFADYLNDYWAGAKNTFSDQDFWTRGLTQITRDIDLRGIRKRVAEAEKQKGGELDESDFDRILTPSEKAELFAAYNLAYAQADEEIGRAKDLPSAYRAGSSAADSIGFMSEFLLGTGLMNLTGKAILKGSKSAMARWLGEALMSDNAINSAVQKGLIKQVERTSLQELGRTAAQSLVKGVGHTVAQPLGLMSNVAQRMNETDDEGELNSFWESFGTGLADTMIENWSESFGQTIDVGFNAVGKGIGKLGRAKAKTDFGKMARWAMNSDFSKRLTEAGFNGFFGEMLEEWAGNAVRLATGVIDKEEFDQFASVQQQLEMAASFAPMSIIGLAGSVGGARRHALNFDKKSAAVRDILMKNGVSQPEIDKIFNEKWATSDDIASALAPYAQKVLNEGGETAAEDYATILDFAGEFGKNAFFEAAKEYENETQRNTMRDTIVSSTGQDFWTDMPVEGAAEDGEESATRPMVRVIIGPDEVPRYIVAADQTEDGGWEYSTIDENGEKAFTSSRSLEEGSANGAYTYREVPLDEYLQERVDQQRAAEEAERMRQEEQAKLQAVQQRVMQDPNIDLGTPEAPKPATVVPETATPQGVSVVVNDENGQHAETLTWQQVGNHVGIPTTAKSDAELADEAAAEMDELSRRKDQYNQIPVGTPITVMEQTGEENPEPVQYRFAKAIYDENEDFVRVYVMDENGDILTDSDGNEFWYPDMMIPDLEAVAAGSAAQQNAGQEGEGVSMSAQEEPAEADVVSQYTDPQTGEVDQDAMLNDNPEAWARWNDERLQDGGADSAQAMEAAIKSLDKQIGEVEKQLASEASPKTRDALRESRNQLQQRRDRLAPILDGYVQQAAAEQAAVEAAQQQAEAAAPVAEDAAPVEETPAQPQQEPLAEMVSPDVANAPASAEEAVEDAQKTLEELNRQMAVAESQEERDQIMEAKAVVLQQMFDALGAKNTVVSTMATLFDDMQRLGASQRELQEVQDELAYCRAKRFTMEGFYCWGADTIFMVADGLPTAEFANRINIHEAKHRENRFGGANKVALTTGVTRGEMVSVMRQYKQTDFYDKKPSDYLADEVLAVGAEIAEDEGVDAIPERLRELGVTNEDFINFVKNNIEDGRRRDGQRQHYAARNALQHENPQDGGGYDAGSGRGQSGDLGGSGIRSSQTGDGSRGEAGSGEPAAEPAPAGEPGAVEETAAETPAEEEITREITANIGGSMEGKDGNVPVNFSISAGAEGVGLTANESDEAGNVTFVMRDGRVFDGHHLLTAEDVKNEPNTVMGYMMADALKYGTITPEQADIIWQKYTDTLNRMLEKGLAENGGFDNLSSQWQWVGETVFKTVSTNSDDQYKFSLDITRVCKKNEAVINAISAVQRRLGYGITPGQVMDIYMSGIEEGYQVPCPVCYVFSRYISNGIYATIAINGQKKYGKKLVDPSTLTEKQREAKVKMWQKELEKLEERDKKYQKQISSAKDEVGRIFARIDEIGRKLPGMSAKEKAEAQKEIKALDKRYKAALNLISQSSLSQWIKNFAIHEVNGETVLYEDSFQGFPPEYALDLRLTADTIRKYPAIQRLRKSGGSAAGKEIHFAANNDMGDVLMMLGASNLKKAPNYYQEAVKEEDPTAQKALLKKASEQFRRAMVYAQQQSLRGGQRMWSWSDNIERLAPDVFFNLMQLQMLGGALQSYSKQLEGANLVANMGGYVNGSLMGHGKGYQEVTDADIEEVDGEMVLKGDITDTVTEKTPEGDVQRTRVLAEAGSPIYEQGGKRYVLLFDDVVGIDAHGREENGKRMKGLFWLNKTLDKAGNILVGMNDLHVRAAMADKRVFFIIPWHASGLAGHLLRQMMGYLGVNTARFKAQDYTDVQEEKVVGKEGKPITPELHDFWEAHKNETDFACGIDGGIPSGEGENLSEQQIRYKSLRDAIFTGVKVDGKTVPVGEIPEMMAAINADAFLSQVYRKVQERVVDGDMTSGDTKYIYPYEYWDEGSTYDTADINGARYLEYCRRLGVKPKFVGKLGYKTGEDFGNFADDKGYWKLLIDRRMYDTKGNFQDLTPVATDNYNPDMVDPEKTGEEFHVTRVADEEGVERMADRMLATEKARTGSLATVDYGMTLEQAAEKYEEAGLTKTQKKALAFVNGTQVEDEEEEEPSIRPSVSGEQDEETQRLFDAAKERFGVTKDIREAGYVLPDGAMLDFSGRHWLAPGSDSSYLAGDRQVDHRDIADLEYERDGNTPTGIKTSMSDFIRRGAIRIHDGAGASINLSVKPTPEQNSVLERLVDHNNGDVYLDLGDGEHTDASTFYDGAKARRVLNDIKRYFDEGVRPDGDLRFSLRGIIGAEDDTEAMKNLSVAEEMEKAGKDARTIWQATGWERGKDGKWRNEIHDGEPKEIPDNKRIVRVKEVIDAPELFASYPQIADYPVKIKKLPGNLVGTFRPREKDILVDSDYAFGPASDGMKQLNESGRSTMAHELQHAIQDIEGFARGGSPSGRAQSFLDEQYAQNPAMVSLARLYAPVKKNSPSLMIRVGKDRIATALENSKGNFPDGEAQRRVQELIDYLRAISDTDYIRFVKDAWKLWKESQNRGLTDYGKLAGEVEARNVQRRMQLSEEGRAAVEPSFTEDVAREEQGVRFSVSADIAAKYPNWMDNQTSTEVEGSKRGQNTQVAGTVGTYKKVGSWIDKNIGKDAQILDASSGLGLGTLELRSQGFNVDDIEPYPGKGREEQPTYGGVDAYQKAMDDGKEYDYIISNAVLNVIPDDWRDGVLHDMATLLKPGGRMFINTRKAGEEKTIKNKIELESPQEVLVGTPERITSYQRFFTPSELKEYVEKELGEGYTVEIANEKNSGTKGLAAVVVKKSESPRFSITGSERFSPEIRQEMDDIKAAAEANGTYLKAPNGNVTNLSPENWLLVRTQNFKNWFGDWENNPENASKVVDENGEPRVVYHGTKWNPLAEKPGKAVFDVDRVGDNFDNVDIDWNFFFTASEASARGYGKAVPVFLNIRNMEEHEIRERLSFDPDEETGHDIVVTAHDAGSEYDEVKKVKNPDGVVYTIRAVDTRESERLFGEAIKDWEGEHRQEMDDRYNELAKQQSGLLKQIEDERRELFNKMNFQDVLNKTYDQMKAGMGYVLDQVIDDAARVRNLPMDNLSELLKQFDEVDQQMFKIFQRVGIEGRPEYEDYEKYEREIVYKKSDVYALDDPNQIKSAVANNGEFSTENNDIRFSVANAHQEMFVSNAQRAVENIRQEKATPEQWLKMVEKNGGLKAGEDKWLGLSQWLKDSDKKTLTKQEVLDFIEENEIKIEETRYSNEGFEEVAESMFPGYNEAFGLDRDMVGEEVFFVNDEDAARELYTRVTGDRADDLTTDELEEFGMKLAEEIDKKAPSMINPTRLSYTTEGLENKREIALTVPTIDPWNEDDKIHFGDAGEGRAVAWIRFGDANKLNEEAKTSYEEAAKKLDEARNKLIEKYGAKADAEGKKYYELATPEERADLDAVKKDEGDKFKEMVKSRSAKNVLFIDEIQSKRHQEAREKGYKPSASERKEAIAKAVKAQRLSIDAREKVQKATPRRKDFESPEDYLAAIHAPELIELENEARQREKEYFEANAEMERINRLYYKAVPAAPFEKNWQELAMKRMLRLAAEEGYDYVAWTKGDQQADRYNLSRLIDEVEVKEVESGDATREVKLYNDGIANFDFGIDNDGNIVTGTHKGETLAGFVGKEMAAQIMDMKDGERESTDQFKIGGEGMKGFYDEMLPRFMNKYGKQWGVKVEDITLPDLENGSLSAHAVPVTQEMKESVMEGQLMFSVSEQEQADRQRLIDAAETGGLKAVIGEPAVQDIYRETLATVPQSALQSIVDRGMANGGDFVDQVRAYLNELALRGPENDESGLLFKLFDDIRYMSANSALTDADIRWMIWKETTDIADLLAMAQDRALRNRWGVGVEPAEQQFQQATEEAAQEATERVETAQKELKEEKKALSGPVESIAKAMSAQKAYDRATVDSIVKAAKDMLKAGNVSALSRREVSRLLTLVGTSTGKSPKLTTRYADQLVETLLKHIVDEEEEKFMKLVKVKASKVNDSGVEVRGKLDIIGQAIIKEFRENMNSAVKDIKDRLVKISDNLDSKDDTVRRDAVAKYRALMLALQYKENIAESVEEYKELKDAFDEASVKLADLIGRKAYDEFIKQSRDALRKNMMERIDMYRDLGKQLTEIITGSAEVAAALRKADQERIDEIHHDASRDMKGTPNNEHLKENAWQRFLNSDFVRFFLKPLSTADQMFRLLGRKSVTGEGYLFTRYIKNGFIPASEKASKGFFEATEILDKKVSEVFGKKGMKWSDLYKESRKKGGDVTFLDGGELKSHELSVGNMLYIYMADKMTDGKMKLRRMGISEEDVERIKKSIDPRLIELADWMQNEFYVNLRNKYNEVHERMFGAPMAAIEDYVPLKILANARFEDVDLGNNQNPGAMSSTITGSIIKRRRNSLALDILHTDAFSLAIEHIQQMEDWAAFAELRRDMNTLLSYQHFRNQVKNMETIYGTGDKLWKSFEDVCQVLVGKYQPRVRQGDTDSIALNVSKGVTAAKIAFRVNTAIKQILSFPAYLSDARVDFLAKSLATPGKSWKWCMENLPLFEKRWKSRIAGDTRLLDTDSDWKIWRDNVVKTASRLGMTPNAFVDATTVAIGAKAMYDTKRARYIKDGYSEEEADEMAKKDAEILYNQTQQSSENAFVSPVQLDRTVEAVTLTTYRNSSMAYQRQLHDAIRTLARMMKPGYRQRSIDFMTHQNENNGLEEEEAREAATRQYNRQYFRNLVRVAVFGYGLQFLWKIGNDMWYLLFGDDDDEKDKIIKEAALTELAGPVEGLLGGNVISDIRGKRVEKASNEEYGIKTSSFGQSSGLAKLPIESDTENILNRWDNDRPRAINDIIDLIVQSGIGVNPQTLTDAVVAIIDYENGNLDKSKEMALLMMRILQMPQSTVEKFLVDEIDMDAEPEARKGQINDLAKRYAMYKLLKNTTVANRMYEDGKREKKLESYEKQFKDAVKKRIAIKEVATGQEIPEAPEDFYKGFENRMKSFQTEYNRTDEKKDNDTLTRRVLEESPEFQEYLIWKKHQKGLNKLKNGIKNTKDENLKKKWEEELRDSIRVMINELNENK